MNNPEYVCDCNPRKLFRFMKTRLFVQKCGNCEGRGAVLTADLLFL